MSAAAASTSAMSYRLMTLSSPLDPLVLTPVAFTADEAISAPFSLQIELLCERGDIRAEELLYRPVCLTLHDVDGPVRYFHGLVRQMSRLGPDLRERWGYALDVVPSLWFLMQTADCRVFVNKTVDAILGTLFQDGGVSPVRFRIYGPKRVREYTVQMNETDFVFASRLMQEEGWFYFFEHGESAHTLVITDQNAAFARLDEPPMVVNPTADGANDLSAWCPSSATACGQVDLKDYNPQVPDAKLEATEKTVAPVAGGTARDVFRWPALTLAPEEVDRRTRILMEAAEAQAELVEGTGRNPAFCPGCKFMLRPDARSSAAGDPYVLRSVVHRGIEDVTRNSRAPTTYSNTFTAFPAGRPWRDAITIERPLMPGIFTATVLGLDGEEIHTDELGRVKIRFPWDRRKDSTADASIWVRVIQPWAGNAWGTQFIPRVGTEVAVAFVDGDVDRPVVIGGLYNGNQPYPFTLTEQKTKSGIRTRSTPNGASSDYSELCFDDAIGRELVSFQAQKDLKVRVKNNETASIGGSRTTYIGQDRSTTIDKGDDTLELKHGSRSVRIKEGSLSTRLDMGDVSVKADLGGITLEAMQSITLKVGDNSITIDQTGISIKGMMIQAEAELIAALKGALTQINADALLTLKGGLMTLN